ncbi:MAG: nucleotide exchange factor GrpE [Gammaproteobacteria bacterium]|nr:nucleotide exchange factor GrpE [Gammaproteobacteria bacterium]
MSEKENSSDEGSLEEAIAEIAEDQPETGRGDEPDHAELTTLLGDARGKADEHWNQCLRLQADIENLHKRAERDLANAHKYALERFAAELLPVKDSLEMGLEAFSGEDAEIRKLREGIELTLQMLGSALDRFEIKEVNPQDEAFDPDYHQAMSMQPRDDVEPNTVVTVVQKGYLLHDRLIRPAMVIVSQAPATAE